MSRESPIQRSSTRGRSVAQYEVLANGGRGRKIAEYPTITAASKTSQVSYHLIRGILDGKHPKPEQYYWVELDATISFVGSWTVSILNPSNIIGWSLMPPYL